MTNQKKIEIPKYVLEGNQNIPASLKIVNDYFRDCGNKNYRVCLVGEKESLNNDLKKKDYQGKPFIHLDNNSLNEDYPFLPISVKNSIRRINRLISNPENDFNKTNLGIHTLGLVPISEIESLNALGYGLTFWNGIGVFTKSRRYKGCSSGYEVVNDDGNEDNYCCPTGNIATVEKCERDDGNSSSVEVQEEYYKCLESAGCTEEERTLKYNV